MLNALIITNGIENGLVAEFLKCTDYDISCAFFPSTTEKDMVAECNGRIKKYYICENANLWELKDVSSLDYKLINEYKDVECDFCDGTSRYIDDRNIVKIVYYNALAFWNRIFSDGEIDLVILQGITHGVFDDVIPITMAKRRNIPCYHIEISLFGGNAIFFHNKSEYIKLVEASKFDFKKAMYYQANFNNVGDSTGIKSLVKKAIMYIGGALLLRILKILIYSRTDENYIFNLKYTKHSVWKILWSYCKFKSSQEYMKSLSQKADFSRKYVVYYLHFEPEATIMVRDQIKSQLLAIQILSESLPDGWLLYVKEHPHQLNMNQCVFFDYMNTLYQFKTKKFYSYINELKSTYIVDPNISSSILSECSMAVATYHGTVALEQINKEKPILLFGGDNSVLGLAKDVICVHSQIECKCALTKINGGWKPKYDTLDDWLNRYVVPDDKRGLDLALRTIACHRREL